MKRATPAAIERIRPFLETLGQVSGVSLHKAGVFYRKARPFAHFHEDEFGIYIDVRESTGWTRFPITTVAEQRKVLRILNGTQPNNATG